MASLQQGDKLLGGPKGGSHNSLGRHVPCTAFVSPTKSAIKSAHLHHLPIQPRGGRRAVVPRFHSFSITGYRSSLNLKQVTPQNSPITDSPWWTNFQVWEILVDDWSMRLTVFPLPLLTLCNANSIRGHALPSQTHYTPCTKKDTKRHARRNTRSTLGGFYQRRKCIWPYGDQKLHVATWKHC